MAWNDNLGQLIAEEQEAFMRKQAAFQAYRAAKEKANQLYQAQQEAWKERSRMQNAMNQEYNSLQIVRAQNDAVWGEYKRIRDYNNQRISMLKPEADELYHRMSAAFDNASNEYNFGSKAEAATYSAEGKAYQEQLKSLNSEISSLAHAVTSAKQMALYQIKNLLNTGANRKRKVIITTGQMLSQEDRDALNILKMEETGENIPAQEDKLRTEHVPENPSIRSCLPLWQ